MKWRKFLSNKQRKNFAVIFSLIMMFTIIHPISVFATENTDQNFPTEVTHQDLGDVAINQNRDAKDFTSIIKSVELKPVSGFESKKAMIEIKLHYELDQNLTISKGDKLSINLEPTENGKDFFSIDFNSMNAFRHLKDKDVMVAELALSKKGVDFTFEDIGTGFDVALAIPFGLYTADSRLNNWFKENPQATEVKFDYQFIYNGTPTGKVISFTLSKPKPPVISDPKMEKLDGTYKPKKDGKLGEGTMFYNLRISTKLKNSNEFVIYDTPDVNLGFDGLISAYLGQTFGKADQQLFDLDFSQLENYHRRIKGDMEFWIYDVYFMTDEGKPRQAAWEQIKLTLPREDIVRKTSTTESLDMATVPKNILYEKPAGEKLTPEEERKIEEAGGLYKKVGKGFKVRIKNFESEYFKLGGYILFIYEMGIKGNSPLLNNKGMPVYLNTASYYAQEIPTCKPGDENCDPIKSEFSTWDAVVDKKETTTEANVTKGDVQVMVDEYSAVDFQKLGLDSMGDKKPLAGAQFTIYKIDKNQTEMVAVNKEGVKLENLITNGDGRLCIKSETTLNPIKLDLQRGNYRWEETFVPENYIKVDSGEFSVGLLKNEVRVINKHKELVKKGTVNVQYITVDGKILEGSTVIKEDVAAGEFYQTEQKNFDGYTFKKMDNNSAPKEGEVKEGIQYVIYVYEKNTPQPTPNPKQKNQQEPKKSIPLNKQKLISDTQVRKIPQTGDSSNITLYKIILGVSILGLVGVLLYRKKFKNKHKKN